MVLPYVLGALGLGALVLPKLKSAPKSLTQAEVQAQFPPNLQQFAPPTPNYQPIPQQDPARPSIVQVQRGVDVAMRAFSATPYDGVEPAGRYIDREMEKLMVFVEKTMGISWDATQKAVIPPGEEAAKPDVLGPQVELRPGAAAGIDVYWLSNSRQYLFPAPSESGVFVSKFILDPKGMSS